MSELRAAEAMADTAAGAVAGALRALGSAPARAVIVFSAEEDAALAAAGARDTAGSARLVGCSAPGVLCGGGERENGPAAVALALATSERLPCEPFLCEGPTDVVARARALGDGGLLLAFADAYTTHPAALAAELTGGLPGWALAGGLAGAAAGTGPAARWLDGDVAEAGVAGLLIAGQPAIVEVTEGCLPIGPEHVVTAADRRVVAKLDGRPAFEAFAELARPLLDDLPRAAQTVFVAEAAGRGWDDFALRGLLGFDPDRGLLATSEPLPVGARIRFALREPGAARENLRAMTLRLRDRLAGRPPRFGFYFDCAGRGAGLFGVPDHDVSYIQGVLGKFPMIGFFGGGELEGSRFHLFSGVLAVIP